MVKKRTRDASRELTLKTDLMSRKKVQRSLRSCVKTKRQRCTTDACREHAIVKTDSMSRKRKGGTWNAICSVESVILEKGTDSKEYLKKKWNALFDYACHPCTGTMLIFSVYLSVCLTSRSIGPDSLRRYFFRI